MGRKKLCIYCGNGKYLCEQADNEYMELKGMEFADTFDSVKEAEDTIRRLSISGTTGIKIVEWNDHSGDTIKDEDYE